MKKREKEKRLRISRRHKKIRAKIKGTKNRPRLSIYRSLKHIYVQLIDDEKGHTLVSISDFELKKTGKKKGKKVEIAEEIGKLLGQKAQKAKIKKVVFDRGGFKYHGQIKALAKGARESGLEF